MSEEGVVVPILILMKEKESWKRKKKKIIIFVIRKILNGILIENSWMGTKREGYMSKFTIKYIYRRRGT